MAMNLGGGSRGRRERGVPAMAEINVTPFVDVALVLLIIFMITAHAMDTGIEIDVPKTKTVATSTKDLPIVSINQQGDLFLGKRPVALNTLVEEIHTRYPGQNAINIKADKQTTMEIAVQVMSELGNAKFGINVVTQLDETRGRR
jgi:biopolymer transport protein ExbD